MTLLSDQVAALSVNQLPRELFVCCFWCLVTYSITVLCTSLRYIHPVAACKLWHTLKESANNLTREIPPGRLVRPPGVPTLRPLQCYNSCCNSKIINITIGSKLVEAMLDCSTISFIRSIPSITTTTQS